MTETAIDGHVQDQEDREAIKTRKKALVSDPRHKPTSLQVQPQNIPDELKQRPQWVVWAWWWDRKKGEWTKPPRTTDGRWASSTNPRTWCTFEEAFQAYHADTQFDGLGYVFSPDDPYAGLDLDYCRRADGRFLPWAQDVIDRVASYTDASPTGTGAKIVCRAKLPPGRCRGDGDLEMYDHYRYFTITGHVVGSHVDIRERQDIVTEIHHETFGEGHEAAEAGGLNGVSADPPEEGETTCPLSDDELIAKIEAGDINPRVQALFAGDKSAHDNDHSRADIGLCIELTKLVGFAGPRVAQLFGRSALARPKWYRRNSKGLYDYQNRTIARAFQWVKHHCPPAAVEFAGLLGVGIPPITHMNGRTDLANAQRLQAIYGESLRYSHEWKCWLVWDGARWSEDRDGSAVRFASAISDKLWSQAKASENKDAFRFACASANAKSIANLLKLAQSLLPVGVSELDTNPYLLNCRNGTVDLRTGKLREHRREDYITRLCPWDYDAAARADVFTEVFLPSVFESHEDVIPYLQRLVGYAAVGVTTEQILAIAWGDGSNGKSTLFEAVMHTLGEDYAGPAPRELLMVRQQKEHPTEIADLCGKRLVLASETDDGRRLAEAQVKYLTGSDTLKARRMHENYWSFTPTHTLFLCTNHKPAVTGTDHAIWRRLRLIPFENRFDDETKDPQMSDKLKSEAEGILRWIVAGAVAWTCEGLHEPDSVRMATEGYRAAEDVIGRLLSDCCVQGADQAVKLSDLHHELTSWSIAEGTEAASIRKLGGYLRGRGFASYTNNGTYYKGLAIKAESLA